MRASRPSGSAARSCWSGTTSEHLTRGTRAFVDRNSDRLTVFQLPTYAPDLNPQDSIWSLVKREIDNLAAADLSRVTRPIKRRMKQIQYRPDVIDGCLATWPSEVVQTAPGAYEWSPHRER